MKKNNLLLLLIFLVFNSLNCVSQKILRLAENGNVTQTNYSSTVPFRYENKHIFIDVSINGKIYNFLFDTGADFCIIDENYISSADFRNVKKVKTTGSSFEKQKTQLIELTKVNISGIDFNKIGAAIMDLSFINDDFPCSNKPITGVIGATILRKSNWQINYANHEIIFSDNLLNLSISDNAFELEMTHKTWGSPKVNVKINGVDKEFIIDTGSSGEITTSSDYKQELDTVTFVTINKEDKSKKAYVNYYAKIADIKIGDLVLENRIISLEKGVSSLIGNELFENFTVTFDWQNEMVFLESEEEIISKPLLDFEIQFKPNYLSNKIEFKGLYNEELSGKNFEIGTEILTINGIDVSNFSNEELCNFWNIEWKKIKLYERIIIETEMGKTELVKSDLFIK
ncbi:MAG: aspartyl protease family protein [Crocinitomicaceae bacterium]